LAGRAFSSERRENNFKGFEGVHLKAKDRIWPDRIIECLVLAKAHRSYAGALLEPQDCPSSSSSSLLLSSLELIDTKVYAP